jgi:uncharacterized protein with PIN domain
MGVPCACGREYDVSLFEFGRTLHCTCGRRVAQAPRVREAGPAPDPPRFAADAMLGRTARWLRILGFDCTFSPDVEDAELARHALEEGRVVLTRDRALPEEWSLPRVQVLAAERPYAQLVEVLRAFGLADRVRPFTRCPACNAPLEAPPREAVRGRVPERVHATHARFQRCPRCGRVYWEGSHVERMRRVAERLRADVAAEAPGA